MQGESFVSRVNRHVFRDGPASYQTRRNSMVDQVSAHDTVFASCGDVVSDTCAIVLKISYFGRHRSYCLWTVPLSFGDGSFDEKGPTGRSSWLVDGRVGSMLLVRVERGRSS